MKKNNWNKLNDEEKKIILDKATEYPFTGIYNNHYKKGTYLCKQCNSPLFHSQDKFKSNCGWPSFDDEIDGAIEKILDADGQRTEIVCKKCKGHLGHIFYGERFTKKNKRYCVNSIAMNFMENNNQLQE